MSSEMFAPGQLWQRILAIPLVLLALWRGSEWWFHEGSIWLVALCGILAFMFVALSIPPFYAAWLRFGEKLNRIVMVVIFGAVYFLFLPLLMVFVVPKNRLRTRKPDEIDSFWEAQTERNDDIQEMMRMG